MSEQKVINRWWVVFGGILIQLCLGAIYAWSAFTNRLTDSGYEKWQTQVIFSVGLLTFAVVMALFAGRWQKKVGPKKVAIAGGLVLGLGYLIAGFSGTNFWGILIGIGILGGAGIGLGYVCPIAALVKWFPDKKGLITGLAVAGFGFGALIWIKLTGGFKFGPVNLTPGWDGLYGMGWTINQVFMLYGFLFAGLVIAGAMFMINPPDGWLPPGWTPPEASHAASTGGIELSEKQMVKTPQFWILFSTFTAGGMAGLMIIGIIRLFGVDALTTSALEVAADENAITGAIKGMFEGLFSGFGLFGADEAEATTTTISTAAANTIAGTAMGLFYALMNGFGRIAWGAISDKTGRKNAIILMSAAQGVIMLLFYFIGGYEIGLYIGAAIIGFNFGGNFALFPAATADYFGNKNVGTNYPWVFMAYGLGGLIGPILGGYMGDKQLWLWAFVPAGIACLITAGLCMALKPVQQHVSATETPSAEPELAVQGAKE